MNKTTAALKLAEEALKSCEAGNWSMSYDELAVDEALASICEALAEQEKQEPVAWRIGNEICAREDWACVIPHGSFVGKGRAIPDSWVPLLYAAPVSAKREWVDLTDDDINKCVYATFEDYPTNAERKLVSAVIVAFKEKNKSNTQLKQSREEQGYVPLSDDAKSIFIDGFGEVPIDWDKYHGKAAPVQPVKQEPVYAFRRRGLDDFCTCTKERYEELADMPNLFEVTTFYAAPVSVEAAVLAEREACAKACDERELANLYGVKECAAAIRGLKDQQNQ